MSSPAELSRESLSARRNLVGLGRRYHAAGWLFGTSGNLSARFTTAGGRQGLVLTASGRDKGQLSEADFVELGPGGELLAAGPDARPSAETSIHTALYRRVADAAVVLHVHTVASALARADLPASEQLPARLVFRDLEMIKGWDIWEAGAEAVLPVLANLPHVPDIARDVDAYYATPRRVPAFVIAGHGITAWGRDAAEANRHLEVTEYLCRVAAARSQAGPSAGR